MAMNSFTPAAIATMPNRIAIALTELASTRSTIRATQSQAIPVTRKSHQIRDAASTKSDSSSEN